MRSRSTLGLCCLRMHQKPEAMKQAKKLQYRGDLRKVENKIEMEPKLEVIRKNIKGLFLVDQNCLKKFTIPKKPPDKDFLTECLANQRDYNEIKQRLNENCLDIQCHLESLWQFHKIEMVHNKDLEEEFIAKRTELREEGKQDKELSSFLVVSRDEVPQICQNGLCTGDSKREINIMKELGNPQLGVYLFRYVDIALNYASKHSFPVENIIIFRVLLGKVKKVQPPKGQKKIVLDPTPNFDCHMSRIHPSLKDSLEDQATRSLVYFYEYNEHSKPVDKPRQCLPYAVIHVKSVNQKGGADSFLTSLKCKLKRLPKHTGGVIPLENCTRVTRIGKSQLIYEHFRKPLETYVSGEVSSISKSVQNWNDSEDKIHCEKKKPKPATRWDLTQTKANIPCKSGMEAIRGEHVGDDKTSLKINPEDFSDWEIGSSTVTTSRLIKDPRLTRREQNVVKQNEELTMKPPFCNDTSISSCKLSPDNVTASKDKKHSRREMDSQVQGDDIFPSEIEHSIQLDTKCATNNCTSSKAEHCGNTFQSACCKKMYAYEWLSYEITSENFEQNKRQALKILNLKSKNSNLAESNQKDKQKYSASEKANNFLDNDYTINNSKEKSSKRISNVENLDYHPSDTCITDAVIRGLSEKSICLSKPELLDTNNFEDRVCISLFTEGQKKRETSNTGETCFNEIHMNQLKEKIPCGQEGKKYKSATETAFKNATESSSRKKQEPDMVLKKSVDNMNNYTKTSKNSDTLDLESTDFIFNLNLQRRSLIETELTNTEHCKAKFEELQTLPTKNNDLIDHEKVNHTVLLTSVPISLGNTEINKQSENTSSNASSDSFCSQVPEIFGQDLEMKNDNTHSLDICGEIENVLEECKQGLSVWYKPHNHGNISEENDYYYLQARLDWNNLFGKPGSNVNLSKDPTLKTNKDNSLYREKSGKESGTELLNTFPCPDLQITITNIVQSKLETKMEKCTTKSSAPKKCIKWTRGGKKKKYAKGQQNSKQYRKKKELNVRSSPQISSLSKGQFKETEQPEKHIKNILSALDNTEALLCKTKCPSQKIIGAMFQLRKARKSVQSLKTVTKAGRKTPGSVFSKAKNILPNGILVLDSFETSDCSTDVSFSSDCAKNKAIKTVSEKNAILDTTGIKSIEPLSAEPFICNKKRFAGEGLIGNAQEKNQENVITAMKNKHTLSSDTNSCRSKTDGNQFNSSRTRKELTVSQGRQTNDDEMFKSRGKMSTVKISTSIQPTFESATKMFGSDIISAPCPNLKKASNDKETVEISALQEENMILSTGQCHDSLASWPLTEENLNAKTSVVQLTSEIHSNRSLSLKTNNSSNKNIGMNCSEIPAGSSSRQKQKLDSHCKQAFSESEHSCFNTFSQTTEQEIYTAENRHCKSLSKSIEHQGNTNKIPSSDDLLSPTSFEDNNLCQSSHCCVLQRLVEENVKERELPETMIDSATERLDIIHDTPLKSLNNLDLKQRSLKHINHILRESTCRQASSGSAYNCDQFHFNSPLTAVYHVMPDETNKLFTSTKAKQKERYFSSTSSDHCSNFRNHIKLSKVGISLKSCDFSSKISEILQKADKTSSLNILHEQISYCKSALPLFITAFEKKQGCSFEHALISREILGSSNGNMQASQKVKPCAIEALVELQIIMETMEFIENKKRFLKGEPTFRSLLWYDDSLHSELFGGHSGYQQQSNLYPAFQMRLKYNPLNELQIYHKQLMEAFENTISENNSYYCLLKLRREIEECESVMKQISNLSDFFLSVPFTCGANFGDSIEDLENSRKSTMDLINISKSLPGMNLSAEKDNHLWIIIEIIGKKTEFVKTCTNEEFNLKTSLFGLEHVFFDAAKNLVWQERNTSLNNGSKDGKEVLQVYEIAVAKLFDIYERMMEDSGCGNDDNRTFGGYTEKCAEDSHNCKDVCSQDNADCLIGKSLTLQDSCNVSEILDEAQSADIERLQKLMGKCTVQLEMLKKYFQILQEEDITILITQENILNFMKNGGINPVILKPEAIEIYTELAMMYETIFFLKNSIAKQGDNPRFRSLLWFDLSLVPELFQCQEKMAFLSYRKEKLLETVEASIFELQEELNIIYDYTEALNCSYALHLLTREFAEFSETRKMLGTSKSPVSMCIDLAPYAIALNYGSTVSELDYNYKQFSLLLEKLILYKKKDVGKIAHVMKVMKTIAHMKFICSEQEKSPLPVVIHQMLKNWRKACRLKRQLVGTRSDHSDQNLQASQTVNKRPFNVTLEDEPCPSEEKIDVSHNKKKKVAASLMTTFKIDEKEANRNMRNKCKSSEGEGPQLKTPLKTQYRNNRNLRERTPITFSQLKDAYPCELIHAPRNTSEVKLNNADAFSIQQNLQDLKNVKEGRKTSQYAKEHDEYFSSYSDVNKCMSVSPVKVQRSAEEAISSVEKLGEGDFLLVTKNAQQNLKFGGFQNDSNVESECNMDISLSPDNSANSEKSEIPKYPPPYNSESSMVTELNKFMEQQSFQSEPSFSDNIQNSDEWSPISQNEYFEGTSMHMYRTSYPYYSWYFYQTNNSHLVTQTYQELNSYEIYPLNPAVSATACTVNTAYSSRFHTETISHFDVRESQSFNIAQAHPMHGYFSSIAAYPYSYQQQQIRYEENWPLSHTVFPYPSTIGL
ncbi:testis-expressed protein 15 isoform X3 [Pantherophis guttatus]|uniref:Testis-expressed protein 15 isoform X3 n=1 Tax=Pantherophis guttatus TaxID=94885 RepID=A0A6P9B717_PANGU|nr:testis-expressed protein 15 isoform X3 [Pantherophis guttatus]